MAQRHAKRTHTTHGNSPCDVKTKLNHPCTFYEELITVVCLFRVMHGTLPLRDPSEESPPRSPPESFSPTETANPSFSTWRPFLRHTRIRHARNWGLTDDSTGTYFSSYTPIGGDLVYQLEQQQQHMHFYFSPCYDQVRGFPCTALNRVPNGARARGHWLERNSFLGDEFYYLADLRKLKTFSHFQNNAYWRAPVTYCGCNSP